jgi:hypothetical protein
MGRHHRTDRQRREQKDLGRGPLVGAPLPGMSGISRNRRFSTNPDQDPKTSLPVIRMTGNP